MPGQAPSPLCKTILRLARAAEQGATGAGLTYLSGLQTSLGEIIAASGQQMISAATAGKSFSFANGWSPQGVTEALDEAFGIWQTLDTAQLATLLDSRVIRYTRARFGLARAY